MMSASQEDDARLGTPKEKAAISSEFQEALKHFVKHGTTASWKERHEILENINRIWRDQATGIANDPLQSLLQNVAFCMPRYMGDRKSINMLSEFVGQILEKSAPDSYGHFLTMLSGIANSVAYSEPTHYARKLAQQALRISVLLSCKTSLKSDEGKTLLHIQSKLLFAVMASHRRAGENTIRKILQPLFVQEEELCNVVTHLLAKEDASVYLIGWVNAMVLHSETVKSDYLVKDSVMVPVLKYILRILFATKAPNISQFVNLCERPLRHLSPALFKEHLLSAMVKAMLRNPESVLPAILIILKSVKFDMGPFCLEIGKQLATQLHSKVDESRKLSAEACRYLARQCLDDGIILDLVRHLFAVLGGSEGKITVAAERTDLLNGIGNLSFQGKEDLTSQANGVVALFLTFIASEAQEAIVLHALVALRFWIRRFRQIPVNFLSFIKNLQSQKSSAVRAALLTCCASFLDTDQPDGQLSEVVPVLTKTVEAAAAKSTDLQLCLEALPAVCCLLSVFRSGNQTDPKRQTAWNAVTDAKKEILTADKLLAALSEPASVTYIQLVEKLLLFHYDRLKPETIRSYINGYAYILLKNPHEVRQQGLNSWERITRAQPQKPLSEELIRGISVGLAKLKSAQKATEADAIKEANFAKNAIAILTALTKLYVELKRSAEDKGNLILEMLLVAHDPDILALNPGLWIDLLRRFHDDNIFPDKLISDNVDGVFQLLTKENVLPDEAVENAVRTLIGFPTAVTIEKLLSFIKKMLQNPEISAVSFEDFMVFKTPAGVLHDKSVLEAGSGADTGKGNIKRESKAYSFKEQMAEMELRKELEAKKKAQLGGKEAPLNPKQKEAMTKQLAKESAVRQTVQAVYAKARRPFLILDALISGNSEYMRIFMSQLIDVVASLLHVPILAPSACTTWMLMSKCADDPLRKNGLATALSITSLRVLEPVCPLPTFLTQENLTAAVTRVVHGLFLLCNAVTENGTNENGSWSPASVITVPDVCFAFPLLKVVLNEEQAKKLSLKESVLGEAFKVISKVLEICASKNDKSMVNDYINEDIIGMEMNEDNPAFLPLPDVLRTLTAANETANITDNDTGSAVTSFAKAVKKAVDSGDDLDKDIVRQLLVALLIPKPFLRIAALQGLLILATHLEPFTKDPALRRLTVKRLFIAAHDVEDPKVVEFARELFQDLDMVPNETLVDDCLDDITYNKEFIRNSSAAALGMLLSQFPNRAGFVLDSLIQKYNKNVEDCKVKLDKFGRALTESQADQWPARRGIARALTAIAPYLDNKETLEKLMDFLLQTPCALKDEKAPVRSDFLELGVAVVELHGKNYVGLLLDKFEECLAKAPKTGEYDVVRQNAIVIMGSLAKHLDKSHPKIRPIVHQLVTALSTPSEEVQKAVGRCIAPLVYVIEDDIRSVVPNLLHVLYESESYAHRRGAAYGLAGIFQGLGIMALKDFDIMLTIMDGLQEKKNPQRRESSLLAVAMLSHGLGRIFEPFVLQVVPYVLQFIGDPNIHVRQAAEEASKVVMSELSGPGVKLVLPALLKGLEEEAWRAKAASIEMLGDMAFCAPRQLSTSLPMVVPKLIEAFGDSHTKVQESAVNSLKKIASVIKNPEVVGLVPGILIALQDPAKKTTTCLKTILQTQFIHVVDAASLALLMPVVRRAVYDRGSENRKLSAQIMASLYSLADQKDLLPYLDGILPGLKNCLLDPAPEVRLCAAKALAALVKGTGESGYDQLKEWLFMKLVSENNSVDRSGAAQGLAESLGVLGLRKLQEVIPQFLKYVLDERTPSHIRDGYLLVFVYLPVVFGQDFSPYISDVIPAILLGLADDTEYVRETALLCGQRIVNYFADSAIELLLPQLEEGMFDENWRIRYASVQLLGDLLYKVAGASGKHTTAGLEEDENFGTEQSHSLILQRLGEKHRNRVLAGLYICRSDNALVVRQAALHVWKVIVTNTPKTLREILSELFEILLDALASDNEERRQVAAKTLGELVRKLGERILPEVIPILQAGLDSEADEHREGVCVGLMEIISSSNKETVIMYCDILEPTLSKALLDSSGGVRRAAADAFCMLDNVVGHKILDDILPVLFDKVTDPVEGERALDGLQQIMSRRSRVVLPYLIPRLTTPPINTKTLALLTAVAGEALSKHLGKVLPSLLTSLENKMGTPDQEEELGYCRNVVLSVEDETGVATLIDSLMHGAQNEKTRMAAVTLLDVFFASTKVDVRSFFGTTIRPLMRLYVFDDPALIKKVASIIGTLIKKTPTDVIYENVSALRTAIRAVHMEVRAPSIPGLCMPEGAAVFIPLLRDALLSASADEKEVIGQTIGDLVRLSNQTGLKSSVVTITGPIIRILGDRYSASVRTILLDALNALIEKCSILIKPFVPQIQTTVSRALSDPIRSVRVKAGIVAANIAPMHPRLDTLANDLLEVAKNNADLGTKETTLRSLRMILANAGSKLSPQYRSDVVAVVSRYLDSDENDLKKAASGVLGALCRFATDDELASLLKNHIFDVPSGEWTLQHGHCLGLGAALREAGDKLLSPQYADTTMEVILKHQTTDKTPIAITNMRCMGLYLLYQRKSDQPLNKKLLITLAKSLNHPAIEVKQLVAHICSHLALVSEQPLDISEMKILVPQLVNGTKEKNSAVRYDSEMALADMLAIRKDDSLFETVKAAMDVGARDSLQNARRSLGKSVMQSATKLEELDETF